MTIHYPHKRAFTALCILLALASSVFAEEEKKIPEIKTLSGKTYLDVRVTKVSSSEIDIMHDSGLARIPLKDLPDDLKTKFGYDPEKAEAHAKTKAEAQAQVDKQRAEAEKKSNETKASLKAAKPGIFIVDKEGLQGLLVKNFDHTNNNYYRYTRIYEDAIKVGGGTTAPSEVHGFKEYLLIGVPNQSKLVQNTFVSGLFVKAGTAKRDDGSNIQAFRYVASSVGFGGNTLDTVERDE